MFEMEQNRWGNFVFLSLFLNHTSLLHQLSQYKICFGDKITILACPFSGLA